MLVCSCFVCLFVCLPLPVVFVFVCFLACLLAWLGLVRTTYHAKLPGRKPKTTQLDLISHHVCAHIGGRAVGKMSWRKVKKSEILTAIKKISNTLRQKHVSCTKVVLTAVQPVSAFGRVPPLSCAVARLFVCLFVCLNVCCCGCLFASSLCR